MTQEPEVIEAKPLQERPQDAIAAPAAVTPNRLLEMAVKQGADLDKLEKLMDLQERYEANEAKKAFVGAMSAFRAECPEIKRTREAYDSKYASLADTIATIKEVLGKHGLSHSWKTQQQGPEITVTCCVTHVQGHSECTSLSGSPDTSGSKNAIQAVGSTVAYLERYTLYAVLGLSSVDMDNDGGAPAELITDEQAMELEAFIKDNDLNEEAFLNFIETKTGNRDYHSIPAAAYAGILKQAKAKVAKS